MEKSYKVQTFVKLLFCDKCGKQITKRESFVLTSNPIKYIYKCECGEEIITEYYYPFHYSKILEEVKDEQLTHQHEDKGESE